MDSDNEIIAARAYQLSQERIGNGRAPLDDWLRAEWELKNSHVEKSEEETKTKWDLDFPAGI